MHNEKVYTYIGRFQIFHKGHEETLRYAMSKADRLVVLVGSSGIARDPRNPFTFEERKSVLVAALERLAKVEWAKGRKVKFDVRPVHDYVYNNTKWLTEVQRQVASASTSTDITLTGYEKDNSTTYLQYFPNWKKDFVPAYLGPHNGPTRDLKVVNASDLRDQLFSTKIIPTNLPEETTEFLSKFRVYNAEIFDNIVKEFNAVHNYRAQMEKTLPYASIPFFTGDALVVCSGHVLLIKRKDYPGKGLYALPGGFMDKDKDISGVDTAIRELKEETRIKVPEAVLRGSIASDMEFGDPSRSLRWRIITRCVYIKLADIDLPKVKGSDDAECAEWVPIHEIVKHRDRMFEDHYSILDTFLGLN